MTRLRNKLQVFLEGTYGISNFGDDLLLSLFRDRLESLGFSVTVAGIH